MLQNMHIKNIALIDEIDINFEEGLNILTGETGAGKSIIIGSLGICLGGRFHKELLRDEEKDGLVELLFSLDSDHIRETLKELGVSYEDDELLISRRLTQSGRTINRVNDMTVTTSQLREIASVLIDLHAQHEQQTLRKADKHLAILDQFGGKELEEQKNKVRNLYAVYSDIRKTLECDSMDEAEKNRQMDLLQYQIQEIRVADLQAGEDGVLEAGYRKAVHAKEILTIANEVYRMTGYDADNSAASIIGHALHQMSRIVELDPELQGTYDILQDVDGMLSDFNRELNSYMEEITFDGQAFSELETRLDLVNTLKAKYGNSIEEILHSCERYEEEYNKLISYEEYMKDLNARIMQAEDELKKASEDLTAMRKQAAGKLCGRLRESLAELNFMTVEFDMHFEKMEHYTANGMDEAYFMISTNVGEPMRPLYDVASGGELSRVMLALKSSLAYEDDTPTLVFDEIDVGISGRTAQKVAEKMSVIGRKHQVICITHLPQIAAMADAHYLIEKNVENNKTISNIRRLDYNEEINEIARLLGGVSITENTMASAKEMKGLAERTKIY